MKLLSVEVVRLVVDRLRHEVQVGLVDRSQPIPGVPLCR